MNPSLQKIIDRSRQLGAGNVALGQRLKTMPAQFPEQVKEIRESLKRQTDGDLRRAALQLADDVQREEALDLILAFALVKEAARRVFGYMHYDVQIEAWFYLYLGWVAEMATG